MLLVNVCNCKTNISMYNWNIKTEDSSIGHICSQVSVNICYKVYLQTKVQKRAQMWYNVYRNK